LGLPPTFTSLVGSHEYLKEAYSLSVEGIRRSLEPILERVRAAK